ncbi:hypothetical protein ACTFIU_009894 [Dictyostelium citrinum]
MQKKRDEVLKRRVREGKVEEVICITSTLMIRDGKGMKSCSQDQQSCHKISLCIIKFLYNHQEFTMTPFTFSIIKEFVNQDQECCFRDLNQSIQKKVDNAFIKKLGEGNYKKEYIETVNLIIDLLEKISQEKASRFESPSLTMENLIKKLNNDEKFDKEKCNCEPKKFHYNFQNYKAHKYNC